MMDERGLLDLPFLVLVVLLVTIGVIMVFSSSYARAYFKEGNSTYYFCPAGDFAVLGIPAGCSSSRASTISSGEACRSSCWR